MSIGNEKAETEVFEVLEQPVSSASATRTRDEREAFAARGCPDD
jgi:hypothetical protein